MSDFFTAVSFGKNCTSRTERFIEGVDDYFYYGAKKKQCVISAQENEKNKATVLLDKKTTLAVLKIFSLFTVIVPLLMLGLKALLRCTHHYHIIDPKQRLEERMNVSNETIQKVQDTALKVLGMPAEQIKGIDKNTKLPNDTHNTTFVNDASLINNDLTAAFFFRTELDRKHAETIQMYPDKGTNKLDPAEEEFHHMIKAKEACIYHNFDHLVIPQAKLIEAGNKKFIAREALEVFGPEMAQSNDDPARIDQLKEAVKQLTRFMIESGLTGKIGIVNSDDDATKKVVLLDPKLFSCSIEEALFGGHDDIQPTAAPLIDAFSSEELIDIVLNEAYIKGIMLPDRRDRIKVSRMDQIKTNPPVVRPVYETVTI